MAKLIFREADEPSKKLAVQKYEKRNKVKKIGIYSIIILQSLIITYLLAR